MNKFGDVQQQNGSLTYIKDIIEWRKLEAKHKWKHIPFVLLIIGSLALFLTGTYYSSKVFTRFDLNLFGKTIYYHLIASGLYIILIHEAVHEWKELKLVSSFALPIAIFFEITFFTLGVAIYPFIIFVAIVIAYFLVMDVLRGCVKLKKTPNHHGTPPPSDDSIRNYKRSLILRRWNNRRFKVIFILSFILLFFGVLGFEVIVEYLGYGSIQIFVILNMISLGFILMTAELAFTEFKERSYIGSIMALFFCEISFGLYAFEVMYITNEDILFLVFIYVLLVLASPIDILFAHTRRYLSRPKR